MSLWVFKSRSQIDPDLIALVITENNCILAKKTVGGGGSSKIF